MANFNVSVFMIVLLWLCAASTTLALAIRGHENAEISAELLGQFNLMAQYAAAAYCPENNNSTETPITCSAGNCPLVEASGAYSVAEFENIPGSDDTGFMAVDDANRLVVLVFRGSVSRLNWHKDFDIIKAHTDMCKHCHIHHGYWKSWMGIRDSVKAAVQQTLDASPGYRFVITGHSLGGALATLAAADFRKDSDDLANRTELFTFGSPRVGNKEAAAFMSGQSSLSYRITSRYDMIPRLPWHGFGYYHTSPEYWIRANPDQPRTQDIKIVTGFYNVKGNSGGMNPNFRDHRHYFMPRISLCKPKKDHS